MAQRSGGSTHSEGAGRLAVATLYRGRARLALLRDLALNEWSFAELAKNMGQGVRSADVAAFAEEHATEISEIRSALGQRLAEETAGLWITKKRNRIAEIQSDFEDTQRAIDEIRDEGFSDTANRGVGSRRHYQLNRIRLALLTAAANELEPRRTGPKSPLDGEPEGATVHYIIEGGDITEALT